MKAPLTLVLMTLSVAIAFAACGHKKPRVEEPVVELDGGGDAEADVDAAPPPSLYQRLGGKDGVAAVIDSFVGNVSADKRVNKLFAKTTGPRLDHFKQMIAFVHQRWREPIGLWLRDPFHRALVTLPSLACLWILLRPWLFGTRYVQIVHVFSWGTITSVMYFGFLLLLLHGDGPIQRALSAPLFRRVATLGYGVYLVHIPMCDHLIVPVARALQDRHVTMLLVWPACLFALMLVSLGVAYLLHILVEKPSLRIRERLAA
jgi:peptidoglycan/LPS O-acetylase OafA/YrhL